MDLSIILPVINEGENLRVLIPRMRSLMDRERLAFEIIVVDGGSTDDTQRVAGEHGARVVPERRRGYAGALETGFSEASGDYVLTLDSDQSHEPVFIAKLWRVRQHADSIIASRYTRGGVRYAALVRKFLSPVVNVAMRRGLAMPLRDSSTCFG